MYYRVTVAILHLVIMYKASVKIGQRQGQTVYMKTGYYYAASFAHLFLLEA